MRWLRRLARWILALAAEPGKPGVPLPADWPTEWPDRANPHYWARGWGHYPVTCGACHREFQAVAAVGSICLARCPYCENEWEQAWPGGDNEMLNDGVWL